MIALFKGLLTVLKHAFMPRVTVCYPEQKPAPAELFRGSIDFDPEKCIGCRLCQALCPSFSTITIVDKKIVSVDLARCINCANCANNCPCSAIFMTQKYELATRDRKDLLLKK